MNVSARAGVVGLALLLLMAAVLTAGCTRVRAAIAVQSDDTVAGEVVVATAGGPAPDIVVPDALAGRVTTAPYRVEDYVGTRLRFSELRFDELNALAAVAPAAQGQFTFGLHRTGDRLVLSGQVDLTSVPVDRADVQLKVALPGEVVDTDGVLDAGAVSWEFLPGEVGEFSAVASSPDPAAPSFAGWTLLLAAVVAATALGVVLLARADRNPPVRPGGRGP